MKALFTLCFSLISLSLLGSHYTVDHIRFEKCQDYHQQKLIDATEYAYETVPLLQKEIRDAFLRSDIDNETSKKLQGAFRILQCALKKIARFKYICGDIDLMKIAKTTPYIGKEVWMNPNHLWLPEDGVASTIIHEATHKCGARDHFYYDREKNPLSAHAHEKWYKTATVYDTWMEQGFCVPGYDCL